MADDDGPKTHLHGRVGRAHPGLLGACTIGAGLAFVAALVAMQAGAASLLLLIYSAVLAPFVLASAWMAFHEGSLAAWKKQGERIRFAKSDLVSDDVVREDVRVEPVVGRSAEAAARSFYGAAGHEQARLARVEVPRRNGWVRIVVVDQGDVPDIGAWLGIEPGSLRRFRLSRGATSGAVALVGAEIAVASIVVIQGVVPPWAAAVATTAMIAAILRSSRGDRVLTGVDGVLVSGAFVPWGDVAGVEVARSAIAVTRTSGPPISVRGASAASADALRHVVEVTLERAGAPLDLAALAGDPYRAADASSDDLAAVVQHPLARIGDRARAATLLLERSPDARPLVEEMRRSLLAPGARAELDAELGPALTRRGR